MNAAAAPGSGTDFPVSPSVEPAIEERRAGEKASSQTSGVSPDTGEARGNGKETGDVETRTAVDAPHTAGTEGSQGKEGLIPAAAVETGTGSEEAAETTSKAEIAVSSPDHSGSSETTDSPDPVKPGIGSVGGRVRDGKEAREVGSKRTESVGTSEAKAKESSSRSGTTKAEPVRSGRPRPETGGSQRSSAGRSSGSPLSGQLSERRDRSSRGGHGSPLSGAVRQRGRGGETSRGGGRGEGVPRREVPVRSVISSQLPQVPVRPDHLRSPDAPIRTIGERRDPRDSAEGGTNGGNDRRRGTHPTLRLAPIPATPQEKPKKSSEPAPQKPELRLRGDGQQIEVPGRDGRRNPRMGGSPLTGHMRRQGDRDLRPGDDRGGRGPETRRDGVRDRSTGGERSGSLRSGVRDGGGRDGSREAGRDRFDRGAPGRGGIAGGRGGVGRVSDPPVLTGRERIDRGDRKDRRHHRDDDESSLSGRDGRLVRRRQIPGRDGFLSEDDSPRYRGPRRKKTHQVAERRTSAVVELPCTVRSFSESLGVPVTQILRKMMELGSLANINSDMDRETAALIGMELGIEVSFREERTAEEQMIDDFSDADDPEKLCARPPVVTFLGHVDHGKTSLLDRLLKMDVARGEKGGITQHIRAYSIDQNGQKITFVDTPGHEAFTAMRARGANSTDIAVLVVAADDGVMPQTEEAISHAKAAGVPIVVALNKMDLPGAEEHVQRIYGELSRNGLNPVDWGGETEVVHTSAATGAGLDDLLNMILVVAEMEGLMADPTRPATGICLESEVEQGRGVIAKILVQKGTLRPGDVIVCGESYGRVKAMYDTLHPRKKYREAGPSTPANITGLDRAPGAGDRFYALDDIARARQIAEDRQIAGRQRDLAGQRTHVTLENLFDRLQERADVQTLPVILRADVRGSIEAIRKELEKLENAEVQIQILQATVGGVTEADVHLADASDAVIIGFNVVPDERARTLADQLGVQVRRYDIIYQVTEDLKAAMEGMLKPEQRTMELGRAMVQKVFHIGRIGSIAGCRVISGTVCRDSRVRIIRDNRIIGDYALDSLKREKDDAKEVREGYECGIRLAGYDDIKDRDILEVYRIEEVKRTLD
ncbi:MAG: translation initiation factor IF-2 [Planctomycetia bacterium]|nr:translation initiation factor IF-2 [Planctomycetia bacterium]